MSSTGEQISRWLSKRYINVPMEWLNACIEWVEQQEEVMSLDMLQNMVYEQWLHSDVREIGARGFLPANINVINKITMRESFCLQVNFVKDISKPAYSQLGQLMGTDDENLSVNTAPQPQVPAWETKPKRMLMLYMTDGVTAVQGMEYRTIQHISTDIQPGAKVLLTGPLECRLGVFLLSAENLRVLGGKVENMKEEFSQQQVLRRALRRDPDSGSAYRQEHQQQQQQQHNPAMNMASEMDRFLDNAAMVGGAPNGRGPTSNAIPRSRQSFPAVAMDVMHAQNEAKYCGGGGAAMPGPMGPCDTSAATTPESKPYLQGLDMATAAAPETDPQQNEVDDFLMQLDFSELDKLENQGSQANRPPNEVDEDFLSEHLGFQYEMANEAAMVPVPPSAAADALFSKIGTSARLLDQLRTQPSHLLQTQADHWEDGSPFTYLSRVAESSVKQGTFIVKALITTLISKLEHCPIQGWRLQAKINDGSASLDVDLDDKVISQLIGYSAQEMLILKSQAKTNPDLRGKIKHAIQQCRENLLNLNCLMTVKMDPSTPRPKVISYEPMNGEHTEQLYARVRRSTQSLHAGGRSPYS